MIKTENLKTRLEKYWIHLITLRTKVANDRRKYSSWKWEIHVKKWAPAKVANDRRIKINCYRQNQWVKKVVIENVAPWDVAGSNEPPMGYVLSKLAVLEGWKEKFPAYRGSVVPTHFQKQVSWGTWLTVKWQQTTMVTMVTMVTLVTMGTTPDICEWHQWQCWCQNCWA